MVGTAYREGTKVKDYRAALAFLADKLEGRNAGDLIDYIDDVLREEPQPTPPDVNAEMLAVLYNVRNATVLGSGCVLPPTIREAVLNAIARAEQAQKGK